MGFVFGCGVMFVVLFAFSTALEDLGYQNYNCPGLMGPSKTPPTSAHAVRPADIKVVGALGDSLTAGSGAGPSMASYRGMSFPIGGDKTLETHVTIPNVLLKYNSQLFGQSHGVGSTSDWSVAQLNVAIGGAQSSDMATQASHLVHLIQTHPQIDIHNDWKLIHIFIGGNDICAACLDTSHTPEIYQANINKAIKILYDNLPRTIISISGLFNMDLLRFIDETEPLCKLYHQACKCEAEATFDIAAACRAYQAKLLGLQTSGIYDNRDDFTLIVQPYMTNTNHPAMTADGRVDLKFFALDCFHFSQYGHAIVAKALWNNMLQPVGSKGTHANFSDPTTHLLCPNPSCPFIRTTKNSLACIHYMTPGL